MNTGECSHCEEAKMQVVSCINCLDNNDEGIVYKFPDSVIEYVVPDENRKGYAYGDGLEDNEFDESKFYYIEE